MGLLFGRVGCEHAHHGERDVRPLGLLVIQRRFDICTLQTPTQCLHKLHIWAVTFRRKIRLATAPCNHLIFIACQGVWGRGREAAVAIAATATGSQREGQEDGWGQGAGSARVASGYVHGWLS